MQPTGLLVCVKFLQLSRASSGKDPERLPAAVSSGPPRGTRLAEGPADPRGLDVGSPEAREARHGRMIR